ncbi:hypothetical protein MPTK1_4g18550 [Marchantia polymorpha subsp. ruderalis]|uniref:Uncharacterized protein n=2 Tax=Marchantia polymorpha TaxID=3197 RepID=A0A176WI80_MARPO|nr:hypothetical protein AXG93_2190s1110 [Marchantia polymorpha subsp. ruderalis]PTQ40280.1 hypothetical protein MARPO_0041s0136 [Marchantia polymorpha]BBN09291.1 hypothetical protein Mp_4g18550 [Marchantia polymorpha subsp. ruderalis]|eukprot:PTQ40280.1 hypothetical protein MARPO_0041s0136 [Marchantia polymorpha]
MAAIMASLTVAAEGLRSAPLSSSLKRSSSCQSSFGNVRTPLAPGRWTSIRCEGIREAVDKTTKKEITREEILQNQEVNESEKQSVFGAKPTSGSFYPRPEVERRPETGDKSLDSIFAFDGAAPETINGRLAMVGIVWAAVAEKMSGLTVFDQLYTQGTGLVFYVALVPLIAYASIVPMLNGESTDARSFGPFTARAERWNGRLAMLGFLSLLLTENFIHAPVFRSFF